MTRWFLDTEFLDDGKTVDLISVGLISQHGVEYYAVSTEFSDKAYDSPWLRENVLKRLPDRRSSSTIWKPRHQIAAEIRALVLGPKLDQQPEFWAYYADYDWVALCQLYGTMMQLPPGFPMMCMDLKQVMVHYGIDRDELPKQEGADHHALEDARWLRHAFQYVQARRQQREFRL